MARDRARLARQLAGEPAKRRAGEFRDNYLGRSCLDASNFWTLPEGTQKEIKFQKPGANVYTGNAIILTPVFTVMLKTTAGHTKEVGIFPLDPADTFDGNTYTEPFKASLEAKGKLSEPLDFAAWRKTTAEAGKEFAANLPAGGGLADSPADLPAGGGPAEGCPPEKRL